MIDCCPRCGISLKPYRVPPPTGLPDHVPTPPFPEWMRAHADGKCSSPFVRGEEIYWNLDLVDQDVPPVKATFVELSEVQPFELRFVNGAWEFGKRGETPITGTFRIKPESVQVCHESYVAGMIDRDIDAPIANLFKEEQWPVIEVS